MLHCVYQTLAQWIPSAEYSVVPAALAGSGSICAARLSPAAAGQVSQKLAIRAMTHQACLNSTGAEEATPQSRISASHICDGGVASSGTGTDILVMAAKQMISA